MRIPINVFLILAATSAEAHAGCPFIFDGLDKTMNKYRGYRRENEDRRANLKARVADCRRLGDELSRIAASPSTQLSCASERDASAFQQRVSDLGSKCKADVKQLRDAQDDLRKRFAKARKNLQDDEKLLGELELVRNYCPRERETAHVMVQAFLHLEEGIASLESDAGKDADSYGQLDSVAGALSALAKSYGQGCKGRATGLSEAGRAARGGSAGPVRSPASTGTSDITGTAEELTSNTPPR